jgi:hypothetical protein
MTGEDKAYMLCTRIHTFTHTFISIVYTYISAITYLASSYLTYSCIRIHSHVAVVAAAAVVVVVVVVVVVTAAADEQKTIDVVPNPVISPPSSAHYGVRCELPTSKRSFERLEKTG